VRAGLRWGKTRHGPERELSSRPGTLHANTISGEANLSMSTPAPRQPEPFLRALAARVAPSRRALPTSKVLSPRPCTGCIGASPALRCVSNVSSLISALRTSLRKKSMLDWTRNNRRARSSCGESRRSRSSNNAGAAAKSPIPSARRSTRNPSAEGLDSNLRLNGRYPGAEDFPPLARRGRSVLL